MRTRTADVARKSRTRRRPQLERLEERIALSVTATSTTFSSNGDEAYGVGIQADGKIVVVGTSNDWKSFAVARYNPDLTPDTSFGSGGKQTLAITPKVNNEAYAMAIDTTGTANNGKIVAAGMSQATRYRGSWYQDFAVARYTTTGALDTSFGGGKGYVTTNISSSPAGNDQVNAVIIDSSDRIVAAGDAFNGTYTTPALARYTPSGALDTTFNAHGPHPGTLTLDLGERAVIFGVALDGQGNIIVVGTLNPNGSGPFAGGGGSDGVFVARFTAAGALDPTFGSGGVVLDHSLTGVVATYGGSLDDFNAVTLDTAGNLVVAGFNAQLGDLVARFTPTGALDPTFGNGAGWVADGGLYRGLSVAIQPATGAIDVGGYGPPDGGFGVQQFLPGGAVDTSFNGTGTLIYTFPDPNNVQAARGLALGPNGQIVLAGTHDGYDPTTNTMIPDAWGVVSITPSATATTLTSSSDPSVSGQAVTFTATVSTAGAFAPTGTVSFYDGTTLLGTGTIVILNGVATATFTTSTLTSGTHTITALYGGDSNDLSSTSAALDQVVN